MVAGQVHGSNDSLALALSLSALLSSHSCGKVEALVAVETSAWWALHLARDVFFWTPMHGTSISRLLCVGRVTSDFLGCGGKRVFSGALYFRVWRYTRVLSVSTRSRVRSMELFFVLSLN